MSPAGLRPLRADGGAADDDAAHAARYGALDDVRLVAADEDAVRVGEGRVLVILRQGDVELAGYLAHRAVELVHQRALQHAQQVEERQVVDAVLGDGLHVVGGDVPRGEHAAERAAVVHDGHGAHLAVAHRAPGQVQRHRAVERRRVVIVEVLHLRAQVFHQRRGVGVEAREQPRRLVVHAAQPHGLVAALADGVLQVGVGNGGDDGVGVRVAVPGDVYVSHGVTPW